MMRPLFAAGIVALTILSGCTTIRKSLDAIIESKPQSLYRQATLLPSGQPGDKDHGRANDFSGIR